MLWLLSRALQQQYLSLSPSARWDATRERAHCSAAAQHRPAAHCKQLVTGVTHSLHGTASKSELSDQPTAVRHRTINGARNVCPSLQLQKLPEHGMMQRTRGGASVMKGRAITGRRRCSAHGAGGLHHCSRRYCQLHDWTQNRDWTKNHHLAPCSNPCDGVCGVCVPFRELNTASQSPGSEQRVMQSCVAQRSSGCRWVCRQCAAPAKSGPGKTSNKRQRLTPSLCQASVCHCTADTLK